MLNIIRIGINKIEIQKYYKNETSGQVKFLDLSIPQYGLAIYDWVICLEVAKHVPVKYEYIFLVRHAKSGINLSSAVPGQPGHYHVNNKPWSLVVESMQKSGCERDEKCQNSYKPIIDEEKHIKGTTRHACT